MLIWAHKNIIRRSFGGGPLSCSFASIPSVLPLIAAPKAESKDGQPQKNRQKKEERGGERGKRLAHGNGKAKGKWQTAKVNVTASHCETSLNGRGARAEPNGNGTVRRTNEWDRGGGGGGEKQKER